MKVYLVMVTFTDGSKEGVMFTDKKDAISALYGCRSGSALAVDWTENYHDYDIQIPMEMIEIDLPDSTNFVKHWSYLPKPNVK